MPNTTFAKNDDRPCGSLRELRGHTLEALKALDFPLHSGPDGRGTFRCGANQALRIYPSGGIVNFGLSLTKKYYRDVSEIVRELRGDDAEVWVDEFLSREPACDPFNSDGARPEEAEAAYATDIEEMRKRAAPILGTPAADYLAGRCIHPEGLLDNLRYVESAGEAGRPEYGALLAAKMTAKLVVAAVQVLFLDGPKKASLEIPRLLYVIDRLGNADSHCGFGSVFGSPSVIVTAEGVEDALSLHQATGLPAVASLGATNLGRVPDCGEIILFFDQDGRRTPQVVEESVQRAYVGSDLSREPAIKVVVPPPREGAAAKNDANLILQKEGAEALKKIVTTAEPALIPISALAARYARLSPEQRANRWGDIKDRIKAARGTVVAFNGLVASYAAREPVAENALDGLIKSIKPVNEYVATTELFNMIRRKLRQHVFAEDWQLDLISIWIMGTYVHPYLSTYPFLLLTAPTKAAGKTTAMIVTIRMSYRGFINLSATEALLAEIVDKLQPTLGLDEIDNLLRNKPEVIGIINGSYNKSTASRGKLEPTPEGIWIFVSRSTWCPKILAGINEDGGVLPEATLSRCLIIRMRPKTVAEQTDPVDEFVEEDLLQVQAYGQAWVKEIGHPIADAAVDRDLAALITSDLYGRDADNFRAILTIAYMGGGELYERVKRAALAFLKDRKQSDHPEKSRQLVADVVTVFRSAESITGEIPPWMTPADICKDLTGTDIPFEVDYQRWTRRNDPITPALLGKALKPFNIQSTPVHEPGTKTRAQRRVFWKDVKAAAERYCPDALSSPQGSRPDAGPKAEQTDESDVTPDTSGAENRAERDPIEPTSAVRRGWKDHRAAASTE